MHCPAIVVRKRRVILFQCILTGLHGPIPMHALAALIRLPGLEKRILVINREKWWWVKFEGESVVVSLIKTHCVHV